MPVETIFPEREDPQDRCETPKVKQAPTPAFFSVYCAWSTPLPGIIKPIPALCAAQLVQTKEEQSHLDDEAPNTFPVYSVSPEEHASKPPPTV